MFKKDPIFWAASIIFVLALALFAITQNQFWLALMIVSYMLRPTLASLGLAKRYVDERQQNLYYRSGNIGFAVTLIMCVIFLAKLELENNHAFELFAITIVVGMAAKALFNVILAKNLREGASKIIIGAGLMIALFSVLDAGSFVGVLMSALPGLIIAGIGLLSKKYPRVVGILVIIAACLMLFVIMTIGLRNSGSLWTQLLVALIIGAPLLTAGICLLSGDKKVIEEDVNRPD